MLISRKPRLTAEGIDKILAAEPKAAALLDDEGRVIGIELPLPDGMAQVADDGTEVRTKTALLGDRVGRDQYGYWLIHHSAL